MTGNPYFDKAKTLKWSDQLGIGFLPLTNPSPYDANYFNKYIGYDDTEIGRALNDVRLAFVSVIAAGKSLVDIGVGSGQFVKNANCYGFDINPVVIPTLIEEGSFFNPYENNIECATFWDSLEHIQDIHLILENITDTVFVSIPIFRDIEHVLSSKHYRPDEHCWYFTNDGFQRFMLAHGFVTVVQSDIETELGREDIRSFICKREN